MGSTFSSVAVTFGDGGSLTPTLTVTSIDIPNDLVVGEGTVSHTYGSGTATYTAQASNCCRIGSILNANSGSLTVQTVVRPDDPGSPSSGLPPMVGCGVSTACNFYVSAVDPAYRTLRWRLATADESGSSQPPGASIDPNTGLYKFTTTTQTGLYSSQVIVESLDTAGLVASSVGVDFLINVSSATTNATPVFSGSTPADGAHLTGSVGNQVAFDVGATDPNSGDVVTLSILSKPAAAVYTTTSGNTASGSFRWTPTAAGQYVMNLIAADQKGAQAIRSVTLDIAANLPTITWNAPVAIVYGTALTSAQLNASVVEPGATGTLTYTPAAGAVLNAGLGQPLRVDYAPDQAAKGKYAATSKTVLLDVSQTAQTITLTDPGTHRFGDAPFTLAAKATSGLPVAFGTSTPAVCSVSGATVTLLAAGDCTISADQAGNANTSAAPQVNTSVTVSKATPALSWSKPAPQTLTHRSSLTDAGITPVWPSQTGTRAVTDGSGNPVDLNAVLDAGANQTFFAIFTPTGADAVNYDPVTAKMTVSVGKDDQAISLDATQSKVTYGAGPLTLSATGGGSGNPLVYTTQTSGVCLTNGAAVTFVAPGLCTVTVDQPGNGNYNDASTVTRSITVDQAAPQLSWVPTTTQLTYGDDLDPAVLNAAVNPVGYGQPPVGTYAYTYGSGLPADGAILGAGAGQPVTVVWTPNAASAPYFTAVTKTVPFDVAKATPALVMANSSSTFGQPLTSAQLSAVQTTTSAVGTFGYTLTDGTSAPAAPVTFGDTPHAGTYTLTATFTPDAASSANDTPSSVQSLLTVGKATQHLGYAQPTAPLHYGDAPVAYSVTPGQSGQPVTFTPQNPAACTATSTGTLSADINAVHAAPCVIDVTEPGNSDYLPADPVSVSFTVLQRQTSVSWPAPLPIVYGTSVGTDQLNATVLPAAAGGSILYALNGANPAGTVLDAGTYHPTASFVPSTGDDAPSQTSVDLTVTQAPQAVVFPQIDPQTYAPGGSVALHATGGKSSQPVTFSVATGHACAVDKTDPAVLALTGAGSCTVTASQAGTNNYAAAPDVVQTFVVAQAAQTVGYTGPAAMTYGDQPVNLTATGGGSNNPVTFTTSTPKVCTVAGAGALTVSAAGTCTVTASQAGNTDYQAATDVTRTFTVAKKAQDLTLAGIGTQIFGTGPVTAILGNGGSTAAPTLTAAAGPACTVAGTTVNLTGAGTCALTANQAGDDNWLNASPASVNFTVAKATPTVNWTSPAALTYEQKLTAVELSATVDPAGLSGAVAYSENGSPVAPSAVLDAGTHLLTATFTPTGTAAANYNPASANATVVVNKAGQLVSFTGLADHTYGDPAFTVTGTRGNSGQPIVYTAAPDCTAAQAPPTDATITITGAGTCKVTANQDGTSNYQPAPSSSQTAAVAKATPHLAWSVPTPIVYGTRLSATQLNASVTDAGVTGTVAYTLPDGSNADNARLHAGKAQTLIATFTPDTTSGRNWNGQVTKVAIDITQAPQQLAFAALPNAVFTDPAAGLTATPGGSGVPVTFTANGTCSIVGATVQYDGAGLCSVTADEAGNADWLRSPNVTRTFTVAPHPQAISFDQPAAHTYGSPLFTLGATGGGSHLPMTYTADNSGVCSVTTAGTVTLLKGGDCALTANQAGNTDWTAAPAVTRTLHVNKAAQTITFSAVGIQTYGDPAFTVAASSTSGLPVRFTTAGPCTVSGGSVTATGVGNCVITAHQDGDPRYLAALDVSQTVPVTYRVTLGFDNTKAAQPGSTIPVKVSLTGPGGTVLNNASISLTGVTVDGKPALYPGSSQTGDTFKFVGSGYQFDLKTTGLTSGTHTLGYSITGDPVRHTVTITIR